jgi:hypothetical protein
MIELLGGIYVTNGQVWMDKPFQVCVHDVNGKADYNYFTTIPEEAMRVFVLKAQQIVKQRKR